MICILEISLIRQGEMSLPQKGLQHYFELDTYPDLATAGQFVTGLLCEAESWLNDVRHEKHAERVAQNRAALPPQETRLTLVAVEEMCRHRGLARVHGNDFATFFLEWFIDDLPADAFELGQWLRAYREHEEACKQSFLPRPGEPAPAPLSATWPAPPRSDASVSAPS